MSEDLLRRLQTWREDFDGAFAQPALRQLAPTRLFLVLEVCGEARALPVTDLSGVARAGRVAPLPGGAPGLLGLAGVRGRLVPVWSLATLLGMPRREERWLVELAGDEPVALAVEALQQVLRVSKDEVYPVEGAPQRQTIRHRGRTVAVLEGPGLRRTLRARIGRRD